MSTLTAEPAPSAPTPPRAASLDLAAHSLAERLARQAKRKAVAFMVVLALLCLVMGLNGRHDSAKLVLGHNVNSDVAISAPIWAWALVAGVVCAACAFLASGRGSSRAERRWVTLCVLVSVIVALIALVAWAARGDTASLTGLVLLSVAGSVPIIMGSTSGVLAERGGTFNIAIEGELLVGAFTAALVATVADNAWVGLIAGTGAGLVIGALLGLLTIRYHVSQVVAGFVLVSFCTGLTAYLTEQVMVPNLTSFNSPPTLSKWSIPLLSDIPVVGPGLFGQNPLFYLAVLVVIAVEIVLYRTRLGLRIRAVGENPQAASSSGIKAKRIRFWTTAVSGAIAGAGGAYFTIGSAGQFVAGMSSGLGWVALAAVILGSWRATQAAASALLFGCASSISAFFGLLKVDIPPPIMLMAPYIITILVVSGVVAAGKGPAAAGQEIE